MPVAEGVPEIVPEPPDVPCNCSPDGSEPLVTLQVIGSVPPLVWMFWLYAVPTVPLAVRALVIAGFAGLIVMVSVAVPVPPAFVALIVTLDVPAAVGVPVIAPVAVLTDKPVGRPVAL